MERENNLSLNIILSIVTALLEAIIRDILDILLYYHLLNLLGNYRGSGQEGNSGSRRSSG